MSFNYRIISSNEKRIFTLSEVNSLLPFIMKITDDAKEEVADYLRVIKIIKNGETKDELEDGINKIMSRWSQKVRRLGGIMRGLWTIDFDNGQGYYSWKHPETTVEYYHSYNSGVKDRKPLQ